MQSIEDHVWFVKSFKGQKKLGIPDCDQDETDIDDAMRFKYLIWIPLLFEDHVSEEEGRGDDFPDGAHVLVVDAHHLHCLNSVLKLFPVILAWDGHATVGEEGVVLGILQDKFLYNEEKLIVNWIFLLKSFFL